MLVRDADDGGGAWLAIGQASHAWASGQIARAWGTAALPAPEPWEAVCLGAEQHDAGMAEWDLEPTLDPRTGRATAFTAMPRATHLALWTAAARRVESQSRYAALLVSLHGTTLYTDLRADDDRDPAVDAYVAGQRAYQEALRTTLGADPEQMERNRRLLFCWDALSLAVCLGWGERELPQVTGAGGGDVRIRYVPSADGATLDPWPFAAPEVRLEVEGRRLPGRFEAAAALHAALRAAPSVLLRPVLRPQTPASAVV